MISIQQKITRLYFKTKSFIFSKRFFWIALFSSLGLILPRISFAAGLLSKPLAALLLAFVVLGSKLMTLVGNLIHIFTGEISPANLLNQSVVATGWSVARDTANMFFILILLVIAFATILGIEAYTYRRMLGPMIMAILLVNFSKTICSIIIEITQVLMNALGGGLFKPGTNIGQHMLAKLGLHDLLRTGILEAAEEVTDWEIFSSVAYASIFIYIAFFVFIALALFFLIRSLALVILAILSPIVFVMQVIPQAKGYAGKWWNSFIKYALFGPVAAFFMGLAFMMMEEGITSKLLTEVGADVKELGEIGFITAFSGVSAAQFLLCVGMLVGGLVAANTLGIAGAKAITGFTKTAAGALPRWAGAQLAMGRRGLPGRILAGVGGRLAGTRAGKAVGRFMAARVTPAVRRAVTPFASFANKVRGLAAPPDAEAAAETYRENLAKNPRSKSADWLKSHLAKQVEQGAPAWEIAGTMLRMSQVRGGPEALRSAIATDDRLKAKVDPALRGQKSDEAVSSFMGNVFREKAPAIANLLSEVSRESGNFSFAHFGGRDETTGAPIMLDTGKRAAKLVADLKRTDPDKRWQISPDITLDVEVVKQLEKETLFRENIKTTAPELSAKLEDAIKRLPKEKPPTPPGAVPGMPPWYRRY